MRAAEILRKLADKIDSIEQPNANVLEPNNADPDDQPVMMGPNQQKLELLKKGVGVESEFDDEDNIIDDTDYDEEHDDNSEIDAMRKRAGISPAVIHVASDDEPLD